MKLWNFWNLTTGVVCYLGECHNYFKKYQGFMLCTGSCCFVPDWNLVPQNPRLSLLVLFYYDTTLFAREPSNSGACCVYLKKDYPLWKRKWPKTLNFSPVGMGSFPPSMFRFFRFRAKFSSISSTSCWDVEMYLVPDIPCTLYLQWNSSARLPPQCRRFELSCLHHITTDSFKEFFASVRQQ